MDIEVGNIVRLKETFSCEKYSSKEWINVTEMTPLQVTSTGNYEGGKEYCLVVGNGFNIRTDCDNLIKIKEKGEVPTTRISH